jgi:hypothetical protein
VGQSDRQEETPAAEVTAPYLRSVADFAVDAGALLLASGAAAAEGEQARRATMETLVEWGWDYFGTVCGDQVLDRADQVTIDWNDDEHSE